MTVEYIEVEDEITLERDWGYLYVYTKYIGRYVLMEAII